MIWYPKVEKHPKLKWCICNCPRGTEEWFCSIPEHVQQPGFWSSALFLLSSWHELRLKRKTTTTSQPAIKMKGESDFKMQTTRSPCFSEAKITMEKYPSVQTLARLWEPFYLLGDLKEKLQLTCWEFMQPDRASSKTRTPEMREKKLLSENRYVKKIPLISPRLVLL